MGRFRFEAGFAGVSRRERHQADLFLADLRGASPPLDRLAKERSQADLFLADLLGRPPRSRQARALGPPWTPRPALLEADEDVAEDVSWQQAELRDGVPGQLWSFESSADGHSTGVYVPPAVNPSAPLCLLIWIHGVLSVCGDADNAPGPDIAQSPRIPVAKLLAASGRPVVLAVPAMRWATGRVFNLLTPARVNRFVEEVRAGLEQTVFARPVSLRALFLAGHSGAYRVFGGLARGRDDADSSAGALAKLREVWSVDTTYGYSGAPTAEEWLAWVGKRRDLTTFKVIYLDDTYTNQVGDSLYKASISASPSPNLEVDRRSTKDVGHCNLPARILPSWLKAMRI